MTISMDSLRICHLGKYHHPFRGGIETHVRTLGGAQAALYENVTVACFNHLDANGKDVWCDRTARTQTVREQDGGIDVLRFGKLGTLARFDFCRGIHSFLRTAHQDFDLLHLHVPNPAMCVWLTTARPKLPLVVTYHSDIIKQKWIRKPFRLIENRVFPMVDHFIVSSPDYRDGSDVLQRYVDKTTVIPFGIDGEPYQYPSSLAKAFAAQLKQQSGSAPLWLCIGRLVYYKGTEVAIRALATCRGRLMIVGSGPMKGHLETLADELGVADRIDWYPNLSEDELVGAYHAATALWFPSVMRSEAFGLVQLEAIACGCPVINTNIPGSGVRWVSEHGVSGLTVPVGDATELARSANRLDQEPELAAKLSSGAIERFHKHFSVDRMVEETNRLYASVLGVPIEEPRIQPEPVAI